MQINLSVHVHCDLERVGFIIVDHLLVCAHSRFAAQLSEQEATYSIPSSPQREQLILHDEL